MTPEEREEFFRRSRELEAEYREFIARAANPLPKIEIPKFSLPVIDTSFIPSIKLITPEISAYLNRYADFKIPDISFPKIEFPEIDYDRIKKITDDNSKYGWTLTGEMGMANYLDDDMVGTSQKEKDDYFYEFYSQDDWAYFNHSKESIVESIEPRWHDLIQECFHSFEADNYKLVIPTLFTIIEGEMSYVFDSHQGSSGLIEKMEKRAGSEESKLKQIALYSVVHSMTDRLFGSLHFSQERNDLINRHRILHGRDEPSHWQKVDALRLINVISSLQFIKEILKEE
ncbi:hypothetical protein [Planococcus sp. ISL-110]|uniref:hypothetical protein n=1 Tax=Planococcus sp. ISL-110 TaxID=2819167 RepID=UPI001BE847AE|nr:hypothetical protein [Planococcus sp. ISL-110]MBT2569339.1 hypothetical protein [Planococcus sp. ISL-110]